MSPASGDRAGRAPSPDRAAGDGRDWVAWHGAYDVPGSGLAQRLAAVQAQIAAALDQAPPGPLRAVSMCAGQGRDLIGVLAGHPRGADVTARLVELDRRNAAAALDLAAAAGLAQVEVILADAAEPAAYAGLVPADLVLACGVFGNITDADVRQTIQRLPQLCAAGGTVIWTRGRWAPDLIPQICDWLAERASRTVAVRSGARVRGRRAPVRRAPRAAGRRAADVHVHDRRGDQAQPRAAAATRTRRPDGRLEAGPTTSRTRRPEADQPGPGRPSARTAARAPAGS